MEEEINKIVRKTTLVGETFSDLTVKTELGRGTDGRKRYLCVCKCGRELETSSKTLQRSPGSKKNCGCERRGGRWRKPELPQLINAVFHDYKGNASKRNLAFELTPDALGTLIQSNCFYCGGEPSRQKSLRGVTLRWNGIDRKNNAEGYVQGNCVPCCTDCNFMKLDRDSENFLMKIKKIAENQQLIPQTG